MMLIYSLLIVINIASIRPACLLLLLLLMMMIGHAWRGRVVPRQAQVALVDQAAHRGRVGDAEGLEQDRAQAAQVLVHVGKGLVLQDQCDHLKTVKEQN